MMCKVRNPTRRGGWRSRGRGAVGRRAAVEGVRDELDQVVSKDARWFIGCLVCAAWWTLALVFCRSAYAAPSVEIDGNFAGYENSETYNGYVVVDAPNEYIATLTLIGEYASLPQIDSDMYAKLSNESSGGRFYELVQEWQVMGTNASGTAGNYPTWAGSTYFIDGLNTVYGYGHVWECAITDALKAGAKQDFITVLDGGSLNDTSQSPTGQTTYTLNKCARNVVDQNYVFRINGQNVQLTNLPETMEVTLNQSVANTIKQYYDNGFDVFITVTPVHPNGSSSQYSNLLIYFYKHGVGEFQYYNVNGYPTPCFYFANNTPSNSCYGTRYSKNMPLSYNASLTGNYNDNIYFDTTSYSAGWRVYGGTESYGGYYLVMQTDGTSSGGGADDTPGDNNWPDDDTPQPPTPNPPTPTTPDPDPGPTLPPVDPHDPVIPSPPTNEPAPTGTTPTDYTPWLRAIFQQLVNLTSYLETCFTWLGSALDDHCQHIRDHMTTCFNWLGEYEITGMSNLLGQHHTYLNGLAQWIVDNIKWENSGGEFDDSNMIYWLRRIYARQGAGDVNSRPVDPATDYSGFAGWLGVLYDAVALDVSDTSLTALTSSLSGLQHTFPFSLPWDVKQVLQALDVSPVTPSASIPSGTSGVSYSVDLHWMDSAMVSVRAFELLVFIVYVMVHTKDLFGYLMGE